MSMDIGNAPAIHKAYYASETRLIYHLDNVISLRTSYQIQGMFNDQYNGLINTAKIGPDFQLTKELALSTSYIYNFAGTQKGNGFETSLLYKF